MQTTGRSRWRPMTSGMSRIATPSSAPTTLLIVASTAAIHDTDAGGGDRSRSGRDERRSTDGAQQVASSTRSQRASSLIQQSTTTAKTCRPNRGRSIDAAVAGCRFRTKGVTTTALAPRARADTNAGLVTVDDVRLASRQQRGGASCRPPRPCCVPSHPREAGAARLTIGSRAAR